MIAFVTGATGFIGNHLIDRLVAAGHTVRGLTRTEAAAGRLSASGALPCLGDVRESNSLVPHLQNVDVVFHLAALVTDWSPWEQFEAHTVQGTQSMLRAAELAGVKRFVQMSSVAVYDNQPIRHMTEESPAGPLGDVSYGNYARSKSEAESAVWDCARKQSMECVILRPALVYGRRDTVTMPRLVEYLRSPYAAWIGTRDPVIDPIYVTDVADCAIAASQSERAAGNAYNVTPSNECYAREFWRCVCETFAISPPTKTIPYALMRAAARASEAWASLRGSAYPPLLTRAGVAMFSDDHHHSPGKADRDFGWQAQVSVKEGLRRTKAWMENHRPDVTSASKDHCPVEPKQTVGAAISSSAI